MKFRIDWQLIKSDPLHPLWVVGFAIVGSTFAWVSNVFGTSVRGLWKPILEPAVSAGGVRIQEGLAFFRGDPVGGWNLDHSLILLSIIFLYVILPPLFLWAIKARARWRQMPRSRFPLKIFVSLGLTGSLVLFIATYSIIGPTFAIYVYRSLHSGQKVQANKDVMMHDLAFMALRAQSFYFVPVKDGGGGGRWLNVQKASNQALTLQEIEPVEPVLRRISDFPQKPSKFVLEVFREDSLAIWGIGSEPGNDVTFVNKDGQKGKLEFQMIVTPKKSYTNERNTN